MRIAGGERWALKATHCGPPHLGASPRNGSHRCAGQVVGMGNHPARTDREWRPVPGGSQRLKSCNTRPALWVHKSGQGFPILAPAIIPTACSPRDLVTSLIACSLRFHSIQIRLGSQIEGPAIGGRRGHETSRQRVGRQNFEGAPGFENRRRAVLTEEI